jgi:hypothetical protein
MDEEGWDKDIPFWMVFDLALKGWDIEYSTQILNHLIPEN